MKLTAPIFILKQRARTLSRQERIPLHEALDRIARQEGFSAWSLLAARATSPSPLADLRAGTRPGDLVLLGARPGQGKTLLGLEWAIQTMRDGGHAALFTLVFTPAEVAQCFQRLGEEMTRFHDRFLLDDSDQICAPHIIARLATAPAGTLVVIDYLQMLDERRQNPDLTQQVRQLKAFARECALILLFLSQIDRRYDPAARPCPGVEDVRLPNPMDLTLFDRTCFLNQGQIRIST